ncbi:MAG: hypothetical protein ACLFRS_09290 [Halomonas sp.]
MTSQLPDIPSDGALSSPTPEDAPYGLFRLSADDLLRLEDILHKLRSPARWQIEHLVLQKLQREGDAQTCRLGLWVSVYLHERQEDQRAQLDLQLTSTPWQPPVELSASVGDVPSDTGSAWSPELLQAEVYYSLGDLRLRPEGHPRAVGWLPFVEMPSAWRRAADRQQTLSSQLEVALRVWLHDVLSLSTVAGIQEALLSGPVGHFGPLETCLLERSGQADLAVDATLLGSADDSDLCVGEATTFLDLYGERFGLWLLHRRTCKLLKPPRKDAPAPRQWHCSVLVGHTAEALIAQTELTETEKHLFQSAGILPHATLWPSRPSAERSGQDSTSRQSTLLDLSHVPDRPRRHLQAIAQLAQQRRLDASDIELLLKMARQLGKASSSSKASKSSSPRH